jgi:hypothetical protein
VDPDRPVYDPREDPRAPNGRLPHLIRWARWTPGLWSAANHVSVMDGFPRIAVTRVPSWRS